MSVDEPAPHPVVAPDLWQRLESGEPADVVVAFRGSPSDERLARLGLSRGDTAEVGFGRLGRDAVLALAQDQDVASIAERQRGRSGLAEPPVPGPDAASWDPSEQAKVDGLLLSRLRADPDEPQSVSVWFRELPSEAELAEAGLAPSGSNPVIGMLDAAAVRALTRRTDVDRVVLLPDPYAS